jgi:hypothetical protein
MRSLMPTPMSNIPWAACFKETPGADERSLIAQRAGNEPIASARVMTATVASGEAGRWVKNLGCMTSQFVCAFRRIAIGRFAWRFRRLQV